MKHQSITIPLSEMHPQGNVIKCTNLESTLPQGLVPVGCPIPSVEEPVRPLASAILRNGSETILFSSVNPPDGYSTLYVRRPDRLMPVKNLRGEVYCAIPQGHGWLVMTEFARYVVQAVDDAGVAWSVRHQDVRPPSVYLGAVYSGEASESTPSLALSDVDLSRSEAALGPSALKEISAMLLDCYNALCSRANASGAWIQPILARFHLIGEQGNRIYSSQPQLIGLGWQCCSELSVQCTNSGGTLLVPQFTLSAPMFALKASVWNLGSYADFTQAIEVEVTPQCHPVDFSALAAHRIVHPSLPQPVLTVALPGVTIDFASAEDARRALIARLADSLDRAASPIIKVAASQTDFSARNSSLLSPAADLKLINSALAKSASSATASQVNSENVALLASVSAPNSFIARCAVSSGNFVAWADITPLPAPPAFPLGESVPGSTELEWSGTVTVTMSDGSVRLSLIGYPAPMPLSLPPLVSYPDASAVKLEIWAENIGTETITHAEVPLSPAASGVRSLYISPSLQPVPLTPWEGSYPKAQTSDFAPGQRLPGAVISAATSNPGVPLGVSVIAHAPVVALSPSVKSQSSWDFSRSHLYAFSPHGIFALALRSGSAPPAASLIDPHPVSSGRCVAWTPSGVAALTDSGSILLVNASRASLFCTCANATHLAWVHAQQRLWALMPGGDIISHNLVTAERHRIRLPSSPGALHSSGARVWIETPHCLMVPSSAPAPATDVHWELRIPLPRPQPLRCISVTMSAASFSGSIRLATDGGPGAEASLPLLSLAVNGEVNAPIVAPVAGYPRRFISLSITGSVSPDFLIHSITLN
ncbi:MAG: hypothetical protein NC189_08165 [Bacteroides sp.]|nr:hypothetical protein [Bacteroides sp.]